MKIKQMTGIQKNLYIILSTLLSICIKNNNSVYIYEWYLHY